MPDSVVTRRRFLAAAAAAAGTTAVAGCTDYDDELPGWTDAVTDAVDALDVPVHEVGIARAADIVTTNALMRVESRPDPAHVHEYAHEVIREVYGGDDGGA